MFIHGKLHKGKRTPVLVSPVTQSLVQCPGILKNLEHS